MSQNSSFQTGWGLIRSNYRLASNLTTLLQKNSELVEQIISEREIRLNSSFQAQEPDINETLNSEDIKNINKILQEFNSSDFSAHRLLRNTDVGMNRD